MLHFSRLKSDYNKKRIKAAHTRHGCDTIQLYLKGDNTIKN